MCHTLRRCGPQDGVVLGQHELAEVGKRDAAFFDGSCLKADLFVALVPVADQVVTGIHGVSLMLLEPIDVVEDVGGFQTVSIPSHSFEGLSGLEVGHLGQTTTTCFYLGFLL